MQKKNDELDLARAKKIQKGKKNQKKIGSKEN